ncbi:hypothetical protein B7486_60705, partial [cyanobacterium TDX16]
ARGAEHSPELELTASGPDGAEGTFGDTLVVEPGGSADVTVEVRGAAGQTLLISRLGEPVADVPIDSDTFTHTFTAERSPAAGEGPLGTFWRVDVRDDRSLTAIGNPVFLADQVPAPVERPAPTLYEQAQAGAEVTTADPGGEAEDTSSSGSVVIVGGGLLLIAVVTVFLLRRRRP